MTYLSEDFLLHSKTARSLYHDFAQSAPILDYHCHLSPKVLAENAFFDNMTAVWLRGDHYKWRIMRENGIDEDRVTGSPGDKKIFMAWAETLSRAVRHPLFDWTHLELKRYFGIAELLTAENAMRIYDICNEKLLDEQFKPQSLLRRMNVKTLCTTDDPVDPLLWHTQLREENFEITTLPTFRPDKTLAIEEPAVYNLYIETLSRVSGTPIQTFEDLVVAIDKRHEFFHSFGCRSCDMGLESLPVESATGTEVNAVFNAVRSGKIVDASQAAKFKTALLLEICRMNHKRDWAQMLHLGVMRNVRTRLFRRCGPDSGVDCIGDISFGRSMPKFFDMLDKDNRLARTVVFNINSADNELFACAAAVFHEGPAAGKMQFGPAWWFLDQKIGIVNHLNTLSCFGLLSRFIGMTTDSRSLLSFPRHEYFRRILCNLLGQEMERGEIPDDLPFMGRIVQDICYNNAKTYFGY